MVHLSNMHHVLKTCTIHIGTYRQYRRQKRVCMHLVHIVHVQMILHVRLTYCSIIFLSRFLLFTSFCDVLTLNSALDSGSPGSYLNFGG